MRAVFEKVRFFAIVLSVTSSAGMVEKSAFAGDLTQSVQSAAPSSSSAVAPPQDWRKETEATCGIACRYHRANDNLTLQALYLLKKIQLIDSAIQKGNDDSARVALGAFCTNPQEDVSDCFTRYKAFQRIGLLEIRQAIGRNEDLIAQLTNGRKLDGKVEGTALVFETGATGRPYLPDVPTLAELEASYLQGNLRPSKGKYSAADIRKWSEELVVNDPPARYIEFRKNPVLANPYQKEVTSYTLYIGDREINGATHSDSRSEKDFNSAKQAVEKFSKDSSIDPSQVKALAPSELKKKDAISYQAILDARSAVNSKLDTDLKKKSPAGKRAPAESSDSKTNAVSIDANSGNSSHDVKISGATRLPSGNYRDYKEDETIVLPPEAKESRYIKYNLNDLMDDLEGGTQ